MTTARDSDSTASDAGRPAEPPLQAPTGVVAGLTSALVAAAESSGFLGQSDAPGGCTCEDHRCAGDRGADERSTVCRYCPICRMAQGMGQADPRIVGDLLAVARDLLIGLGAAIGAAGQHRTGPADPPGVGLDPSDQW